METGIMSPRGRIGMRTYWLRWLICVIISYAAGFGFAAVGDSGVTLYLLLRIALIAFMIIQGIKRMHDVDKSGWYILIPIYNIILAVSNGQPEANRFGPPPEK